VPRVTELALCTASFDFRPPLRAELLRLQSSSHEVCLNLGLQLILVTLLVEGHRCVVIVPRSKVTANVQMWTVARFRFAARPTYPAVGFTTVRPSCGGHAAGGVVG
jgi:hypothetical protein